MLLLFLLTLLVPHLPLVVLASSRSVLVWGTTALNAGNLPLLRIDRERTRCDKLALICKFPEVLSDAF